MKKMCVSVLCFFAPFDSSLRLLSTGQLTRTLDQEGNNDDLPNSKVGARPVPLQAQMHIQRKLICLETISIRYLLHWVAFGNKTGCTLLTNVV